VEFKGMIAEAAWRTYWVTMAGFGIAIVVGVLLGLCDWQLAPGLCSRLPADDGIQRIAQGGNSCPSWWSGSALAWGRPS
jgi:ABC-type dipeptide/oligopeptide/nickel transport system permease component